LGTLAHKLITHVLENGLHPLDGSLGCLDELVLSLLNVQACLLRLGGRSGLEGGAGTVEFKAGSLNLGTLLEGKVDRGREGALPGGNKVLGDYAVLREAGITNLVKLAHERFEVRPGWPK
jgi:hypothetical protein